LHYNLDESFGFVIHDIGQLLRKDFDRQVQSFELTQAQWKVLMHLKRRDGIRQNELAGLLEIQPISLTRMIDRLVKNGWAERRADPNDRRANCIYLTKKVEPIMNEMIAIGKNIRTEALSCLSQDEQSKLMSMLLDIRANVTSQQKENS